MTNYLKVRGKFILFCQILFLKIKSPEILIWIKLSEVAKKVAMNFMRLAPQFYLDKYLPLVFDF